MRLVDSSGWIEFFTDGPMASKYAGHLKDVRNIVTPTIVLYEVYKKIKRERTEDEALRAVSVINRTKVVELSESIALLAADLGMMHDLPMADAIVYATALEADCKVITGDAHFRGLSGVVFVE